MKRQGVAVALVVAFWACGHFADNGAREAASAPALAKTAQLEVRDAGAGPVAAPVVGSGPLQNASALKHLFEALARLDDGGATDDVRVTQFGDSHTAADFESGVVRKSLQARFGDGGRGFIQVGRPWKSYMQDGVKAPGMTKDWTPERGKLDHGKFVGDGCYGLVGVCLTTDKKGARAWTDVSSPSAHLDLSYMEQPQGGTFELLVDGTVAAKVSTRGKANASAFKGVDVPEGPHHFEVTALGDGEVRFYGMALDRPKLGLVWDALGINGARASTVLQWNEHHMSEQLQHRAPDLVVIAYGTNESADPGSIEVAERQTVDLLGRIARAVPAASCMVMGPVDRAIETSTGWMTAPRLPQVVDMERAVALAAGCAFYDQYSAMGGDGSIAAWADETPPRAAKDHVHLTREGYAVVGQLMVDDLVRAYAAWRAAQGLSPVQAPPPAPVNTAPEDRDDKPPANSPFVAIPM